MLVTGLALAGCTSYQPVVQQPGQSWAEARAAAQRAAARRAAEQRAAARTHRVREGESLSRLAQQYEVPAREIVAANQLAKPYRLRTGQTLLIPGRPAPATLPPPEAPATVAQDRAAREAVARELAAEDSTRRDTAAVRVAELEAPLAAARPVGIASGGPSVAAARPGGACRAGSGGAAPGPAGAAAAPFRRRLPAAGPGAALEWLRREGRRSAQRRNQPRRPRGTPGPGPPRTASWSMPAIRSPASAACC